MQWQPLPRPPAAARGGHRWLARCLALAGIVVLHAGLLLWLGGSLSPPAVVVTPPSVVGELVADSPAPKPPTAAAATPQARPTPSAKPAAKPDRAPPSRTRSPTLPLPIAAQPAPIAASPPAASQAPASASPNSQPLAAASHAADQPSEPAPVTPPRSDAAALHNPAPNYPPASRIYHEQGRVLLDVYILADGSIGQIKMHQSSGYPRLDEAALNAVRRWHYLPAHRGDEAIAYWYLQPIDFELAL